MQDYFAVKALDEMLPLLLSSIVMASMTTSLLMMAVRLTLLPYLITKAIDWAFLHLRLLGPMHWLIVRRVADVSLLYFYWLVMASSCSICALMERLRFVYSTKTCCFCSVNLPLSISLSLYSLLLNLSLKQHFLYRLCDGIVFWINSAFSQINQLNSKHQSINSKPHK